MRHRNRKKEQLSIEVQMRDRYTFTGAAWIVSGVCEWLSTLFGDPISFVFSLFSMVSMLLVLYFILKVQSARKEISDEMAQYHMMKAELITLTQIYILLSGVFIVAAFFGIFASDVTINLGSGVKPALTMAIGLLNFLIGFNFHRLEAE